MKINFILIFIFLFALNGCKSTGSKSAQVQDQAQTVSVAGSGTLVIRPIIYKKESYVRDAIRKECKLDERLATQIKKNASKQFTKIITRSNSTPANAQVLKVEIAHAQGRSNVWTGGGAKSVVIIGKLIEGGKQIGSFKAARYSGGGMFGGYKGTCAILGRCANTLGKDVAKWLANPTQNASLGNL